MQNLRPYAGFLLGTVVLGCGGSTIENVTAIPADASVSPDPCDEDPCANGGTCFSGAEGVLCACPTGFEGPTCGETVSTCEDDPCGPGRCVDGPLGAVCTCPAGLGGPTCEETVDPADGPCAESPCQNGGTCLAGATAYECACTDGFGGPECAQILLAELVCPAGHCLNGGTCNVEGNALVCTCLAGTSGPRCESSAELCDGVACGAHGTCATLAGKAVCVCEPGYEGQDCTEIGNPCDPDPCFNGGTCQVGRNGFTCSCLLGFIGDQCQTDEDDCPNALCTHGDCVDQVGGALCLCDPGYTGPNCDQFIDACAANPCFNGGTCSSDEGAFECTCLTGFTGAPCETDFDDCAADPCVNGTCVDVVGGYVCLCETGWEGATCAVSTDHCSPNPCGADQVCKNSLTGYECLCPVGFEVCGGVCTNTGTSNLHCGACTDSACSSGKVCLDGKCTSPFLCQTNHDPVPSCAALPLDVVGCGADGLTTSSGFSGTLLEAEPAAILTFDPPLSIAERVRVTGQLSAPGTCCGGSGVQSVIRVAAGDNVVAVDSLVPNGLDVTTIDLTSTGSPYACSHPVDVRELLTYNDSTNYDLTIERTPLLGDYNTGGPAYDDATPLAKNPATGRVCAQVCGDVKRECAADTHSFYELPLQPGKAASIDVALKSSSGNGTNVNLEAIRANGDFICNLVDNELPGKNWEYYNARIVNQTQTPQTIIISPDAWGGAYLYWNLVVAEEP